MEVRSSNCTGTEEIKAHLHQGVSIGGGGEG